MEADRVAQIACAEFFPWGWRREAAVIKALAVRSENRLVILCPAQYVGQVLAGRHVSDVPLRPVRAARRYAVGEFGAVAAGDVAYDCQAAVG